MDAAAVEELREALVTKGSAKIIDARGRRLYLIHSRILQEDFDGVVVAYEGAGAFVFNLDRPVNKFRLVSSGFDMSVAEIVADLINRMTEKGVVPVLSGGRKPKLLTGKSRKSKE